MDDLEKVETIRTKCNVSYTDAKAALDAADGNVLDAIIWLESQGKTQTTSAHAATESAPVDEPSAEMVAAQAARCPPAEKPMTTILSSHTFHSPARRRIISAADS